MRGVEFTNCENIFTIAGMDVRTCEIIYIYLGWAVQGSTFRVEKNKTARIKGIVSFSGYKSASLNGVRRVMQILNNYGGSILSVVAFNPWTLNLEPLSWGKLYRGK